MSTFLNNDQSFINNSFKAKPFLKWAGGKRSLINQLSKFFPEEINTYYEPFIGGGAVFFNIAHTIKSAQISDLNKELIQTYYTVKDDAENLIKVLRTHEKKHSKDYYYQVRKRNETKSEIKRAARLIYMNKTCFNGLYRVNSKGKFNVPLGRYVNPNICDEENLKRVSDVLKKCEIKNLSFEDIRPKAGSFIYCDPPYHDCFSSYQGGGFTDEHHTRLAHCVKRWSRNCKVMISNSDTKFIRKIYEDLNLKVLNFHSVETRRFINCQGSKRSQLKELVITTY